MAEASKLFKPRRGKASTMNGAKNGTLLAAGEFFLEYPDTGVGTGRSRIKMGDGATTYGKLPYAIDFAENQPIYYSNNTAGTAKDAIDNAASGSPLGTIVAALKQAITKNESSISTLGDNYNTLNGKVSNLGARVTTAEGNITSLDSRIGKVETNITNISNNGQTYDLATSSKNGLMSMGDKAKLDSYPATYNEMQNNINLSAYYKHNELTFSLSGTTLTITRA